MLLVAVGAWIRWLNLNAVKVRVANTNQTTGVELDNCNSGEPIPLPPGTRVQIPLPPGATSGCEVWRQDHYLGCLTISASEAGGPALDILRKAAPSVSTYDSDVVVH